MRVDGSLSRAAIRVTITRAVTLISFALFGVLAGLGVTPATAQQTPPAPQIWTVPEIGALPNDAASQQVRRGRDLITATYAHVGPEVADPAKRFAGNNLACANCHLEAGTKKFGIPLFGLFWMFPEYTARGGGEITLEDRLNACMTRSMNGRPHAERFAGDAGDHRLHQIPLDRRGAGRGAARASASAACRSSTAPPIPRAGKTIYATACLACHNTDGSGIRRSLPTTDLGYMIPPLWGSDSFNDGAGMARLITAANFIHFNMPHGADYLHPQLTVEQAWDVAAYVISQPRPHKAGLDKDFPNLLEKPVDTPYGPYADGFSQQQHKYGPFAPIRAAIARLKAEKEGSAPAPR